MSATVIDRELTALHASYIEAVNSAIAHDDVARAEELASRYDEESLEVFVRHGRIAPLPSTLQPNPGALRRLVQRLGHQPSSTRTAA